MAVEVTMPQLGETVTEGTILSWNKQVGDTIAEDEVLLEISTDKVDTEVPSPVAGVVLQILVAEGETVGVGTPLAVIGAAGEEVGAPTAAEPVAATPAAAAPGAEPDTEPMPVVEAVPPAPVAGGSMRAVLSPVVRKLAAEHDVDLSLVSGTGKDGRITRKDVMDAIAAVPSSPVAEPEPPVPEPEPEVAPAAAPAADVEIVPLDRLRVRIAENMVAAKQTAAHVFTSVEVDYEAVERVRRHQREAFRDQEGFSLTYLPFIARATVDALATYPVVNSSFDLEAKTATLHRRVNLGIAVDVEQKGLIVTTIRGADGLRLRGLAREARRLADRARSEVLTPDEVAGSTFTITNPGPFGSFMSVPIINVPNTGVLSTDTVVKRPAVVSDRGSDAIAIRHIGYLGLSWDHRAFDGSTAVLFLRKIKDNLESWDWAQELA